MWGPTLQQRSQFSRPSSSNPCAARCPPPPHRDLPRSGGSCLVGSQLALHQTSRLSRSHQEQDSESSPRNLPVAPTLVAPGTPSWISGVPFFYPGRQVQREPSLLAVPASNAAVLKCSPQRSRCRPTSPAVSCMAFWAHRHQASLHLFFAGAPRLSQRPGGRPLTNSVAQRTRFDAYSRPCDRGHFISLVAIEQLNRVRGQFRRGCASCVASMDKARTVLHPTNAQPHWGGTPGGEERGPTIHGRIRTEPAKQSGHLPARGRGEHAGAAANNGGSNPPPRRGLHASSA